LFYGISTAGESQTKNEVNEYDREI